MSIRLYTFQVQGQVSRMWRHMFDRGRSQEQKILASCGTMATADRGPNLDSFNKCMLDACDVRDDEWGHQVRIRVEGAVSDLFAANRQYHKECMSLFRGPRNLKYPGSVNEVFTRVVNYLTEDRSRIWNSAELHEQ